MYQKGIRFIRGAVEVLIFQLFEVRPPARRAFRARIK